MGDPSNVSSFFANFPFSWRFPPSLQGLLASCLQSMKERRITDTGQENYEDYELTTGEWAKVIEKAKAAPEADVHLYMLRSLANKRVVTSASIKAFKGRVVETAEDRKTASTAIGNISRWVRDGIRKEVGNEATNPDTATFYQWNEVQVELTIGHFQRKSLSEAFDGTTVPKRRKAGLTAAASTRAPAS